MEGRGALPTIHRPRTAGAPHAINHAAPMSRSRPLPSPGAPRRRLRRRAVEGGAVALGALVALLLLLQWWSPAAPRLALPSLSDGALLRAVANFGAPAAAPAVAKPVKIAYVVSLTGCAGAALLAEGAAVLRHSIHRASVRGPLGGRYDYDCLAVYHPAAANCTRPLQDLGWRLLRREVLVNVSDIRGEYLRTNVERNGCCGEKELLKLEAYTLTEYPVAVHLDLDTLVLKPMDDLFDLMLADPDAPVDAARYAKILMRHPPPRIPERVDAFVTYDYNMVNLPSDPNKPVQGGLIVVRPDHGVYEEFRQIVLEGDFRDGSAGHGHGWGGQVGPFYGAMTIQGLVSYYYNVLHPGRHLELNRCVYNQMCDDPWRLLPEGDPNATALCLSGEAEDCEDCRARPMEDVVLAHYTLCMKPWWCHPHDEDSIEHHLCRNLTREWHRQRSELEAAWGRPRLGTGDYFPDTFFGHCQRAGHDGYLRLRQPYGTNATAPE